MEMVDPTFADEALGAISKKAIERKTGARGLRSIMEIILLDTAPTSSSSAIRCSRCSSFCSMSQFMWASPHVFLPG